MERNKKPDPLAIARRQVAETTSRQAHQQRTDAAGNRSLRESVQRNRLNAVRNSALQASNPHQQGAQPPNTQKEFPIQHHESMQSGGQLQNRLSTGSESPSLVPANPRLSAVISENQPSSKRSSQVSTASTNASTKSKQKTHIGPWRLGRTLGKGSTARVRLAKHEITGQLAAIKIVSKKTGNFARSHSLANDKMKALMLEDAAEQTRRLPFGIEREVVIMKLIEHPNVIQLYDVWENRNELYLVLEYVDGGELWQHLYDRGRFEERQAVGLFRQILSAISHCHQFNICHRDMKPENILLDKDGNIKLADFGMAALQPQGVMLLTSCGSPHYAAPELLQGKEYNGTKVDVWAIGVILYSLLAGTLPFDGSSVPSLLAKILKGKYYMPPEFSQEARSLISCLLQSKPERRLSVNEIWHHSLLMKYSDDALAIGVRDAGRWVGPPMPISPEEIGRPVSRAADIDREILRNLQTLWHGEDAEVLRRRLLSREHNQEKTFYYLLMKYREQSLEDYQGPGMINYSASDYHHISPTTNLRGGKRSQSYVRIDSRQGSRYSIISRDYERMDLDERDETRTEKSYDPFRASREPVMNERGDFNVTILRHHSNAKRSRAGSVAKTPGNSRIQDSQASHRPSSRSSMRSSVRGRPAQYPTSAKRVGSRSSLASSRKASVSAAPRVHQVGKREIAFKYSNRNSRVDSDTLGNMERPKRTAPTIPSSPDPVIPSSPPVIENILPTSSPNYRPIQSTPTTGRSRADSTIWKEATRKASAELGVLIDEAFKPRSSIASSIITSDADAIQVDYKTPTTSFLDPEINGLVKSKQDTDIKARHDNRPLPPTPLSADLAGLEELEKTKARLIERAAAQGDGPSRAFLDDMIERLDRMMSSTRPPSDYYPQDRRVVSDSESQSHSRAAKHQSGLRMHDPNQFYTPGSAGNGNRHVSEPISFSRPTQRQNYEKTIRVVDQRSPKIDLGNRQNHLEIDQPTMSGGLISPRELYDHRIENSRSDEGVSPELETIEEVAEKADNRNSKHESVENKKKSWWRRSSGSVSDRPKSSASTKDELMAQEEEKKTRREDAVTFTNDHYPESRKNPKKSIFNIFGKRRGVPPSHRVHVLTTPRPDDIEADAASIASASTDFRCSSIAPSELFVSEQRHDVPRPIVHTHQNWLARFLHIRPKTKILCFSVGRRRARREIVAVFREWRKYGMKDIVQDRERNVIFTRVDQENFLKIKPVSLAAEVLTILEDGRRASLSTACFTQEKGAASSFSKVMETLETVLRRRGLLVEDLLKSREMADLTKEVIRRKDAALSKAVA